MNPDTALMDQITPYQPWLILGGVIVLFMLLRVTRKALRKRVDEIGYRLMREKGLLIWFWLNAPGVMLHELSHALVVLLFTPFGFRITSVTLFRITPMVQRGAHGHLIRRKQSLQLGEVQYARPQGRFMSYVGDGFSGIAPLFGGIAMLTLLYWIATGYNLWDPFGSQHHLQFLRPGWPWWTLTFTPYLILTVTSELWPSHQDWRGARWFVGGLSLLIFVVVVTLWYLKYFNAMLQVVVFVSSHIDFALLVLLALDLVFLLVAEGLVQAMRR